MKYKIGDKVKIRSDLQDKEEYGDETFEGAMSRFLGMDARIKAIYNGYYTIDIDYQDYFWTDEMFLGKVEEDIVKELIERGLSVEEIQDVYNRYMSHLNKVEELERENEKLKKEFNEANTFAIDCGIEIAEYEHKIDKLQNRISYLERSLIDVIKQKYAIN